jgi:LuxR family transcriptional regulator, maltose regulon positive regulatory protein
MNYELLLAVGREAISRGDWGTARQSFEAALEVDPDSPEALEGLGWALYWMDEAEPSFAARESAYRILRERGELRGAARVATGLALDYADFGGIAVTSGWLQRVRKLLEDLAPGAEHGWLALWEGHLARALDHDLEKAERLAIEAGAIGKAHGIVDLELLATALQGLVRVTAGDVEGGMQQLDEATAAAVGGEFSDLDSVVAACCFLVHACERVWDYDRASQWANRLDAFSKRWQLGTSIFALCESEHAAMRFGRGQWLEAEREILRSIEALQAKRPLLLPGALALLGELRRRQGRIDEALEIFDRAGAQTLAVIGRAAIALDRGDPEETVSQIERLRRRPLAEKWMERIVALHLLVRARLELGDREGARTDVEEAEAMARQVATSSARAFAAASKGLLAGAEGDHRQARVDFEDAIDLFDRCGTPWEAATVRLDLARSLLELGRHSFAVQEARAARDGFAALGAVRDTVRAEQLLARVERESADTSRPSHSLTPREIQVLRLVALGGSDKEVAAELGLSEHTVHRHVSNILNKLDLPSRTAAVARAAQLGILEP